MAGYYGHKNFAICLKFNNQGRRLVSTSIDSTLRIWDTETGVTLQVFQGNAAGVIGVEVEDDIIYSAGNDGYNRRWKKDLSDASGGLRIVDLPSEPDSSTISPDGSMVAVGFTNGDLIFYSLPDGKLIRKIEDAHDRKIRRLDFSPDGSHIASGSYDDTVKLWRVEDGKLLQTYEDHTDGVHAVAISSNGKFIASTSYDGRIGIFEIGEDDGEFYKAHEGRVYSVVFDDEGKLLLSAGLDGATRL
ncbi:MAG: WD40 repeat domain-containing protein, partial [Planctomycetes bacterium]|nr:WD40 repeat domain-containing protein [Planctomycetota bacterium]